MALDVSSEQHGGPDHRELESLGLSGSDVLDFSVNSNPFGPSPLVQRAVAATDVSVYPDRECIRLREILADVNGVETDRVLVGNGSAELVWLISQAMLVPGDLAMVVGPTFGEYARAAAAVRARVMEVRAEPPEFLPPVSEIVRSVQIHRPRLLFLCNPNNPTGRALGAKDVSAIVEACDNKIFLILDEAYHAFVDSVPFAPPPRGQCIALRSMTKDFALAGLRLGYALGDPKVLRRLADFQPTWSVNSVAQAAGIAALADREYYTQTLARLHSLTDSFFGSLRHAGARLVPSDTHFAIIHLNEPAQMVRQRLLQRRIQVRDCASFGLPFYIRVSTRIEDHNRRLLSAVGDAFRA